MNPVDHRDKFDNIDSDGYDEDGDGELDNDEEYNNFEEWHNWESNPINDDSDSDGLSDGWEDYFGSEAKRDGIDGPNPVDKNDRDKDSDNDGIYYYVNNVKYSDLFTNYEEFVLGTNPIEKDTDGDGDGDYEEIWYGDNDRDGLLNGWEKLFNGSSNNKNDYVPKYPEFGHGGFYPDKADSDLDGIPDGAEDYDQDGRNNTYEQYIYGDVRVREIKEGPGTSDPTDPKMTPEDVRAKARAVHLTRSAEYYGENEKNLSSELKLNLIYVLKLIFNEKTIQQVLQLLSVFVIDNIQRWQFYLPTIIFY